MANSTQNTILSDLEEDACKNEKKHPSNGTKDKIEVEDSSIFKSFFEPEEINHSDKLSSSTLMQNHSLKEMYSSDLNTEEEKILFAYSNGISGHSDVTEFAREIEGPGKKMEFKMSHIQSSISLQNEIEFSKNKHGDSKSCSREVCHVLENATLNGKDDEVKSILDNDDCKISKINQFVEQSSEFENPDSNVTNKESNSFSGDKNSILSEKVETLSTGSQESPENYKCDSLTEPLMFLTNNSVAKENCDVERKGENTYTDKLPEVDRILLQKEKNLTASTESIYDSRMRMYEKIVNTNDLNCEPKKIDPFNLSGDEDFSPKAYKPIKRKVNQGLVDMKTSKMDMLSGDIDDVSVDVKRQKLIQDEDISLSDMNERKPVSVSYVHSRELVEKANKLIRIEGRAQLVHSLIEIYGILQHVDVIPPRPASEAEIAGFHCSEYMDFLKTLKSSDDLSDSNSAEAEAYGLSYDCPVQEEVFETASLISGATITAAESLISGQASIAINWCGGWHHAKRDSASGFCYINDIVLGILKLREKFDRVLYVDLDLHHGDGVEEAFYMTPKVMTISFHKYAFGFFPGSGSVEDTGSGRGKLYSINVPLLDGIRDKQFFSIFTSVMKKVREKFSAEAIVIQCGADTLSEDPMASFNLTHVAIAKCVCFLLTWNLPTLLLGGGGYNFPNTAKCWTFLTAMAAGKKLPVDIPEHEYLIEYGPSYELTTSQGNRKDCNTKEHFYEIMAKICKNLNSL